MTDAVVGGGATLHHGIGEARWPMAAAVISAMVLTALLPEDLRFGPNWALPVVEGVLLIAVVAGDPGRIDRLTSSLRWLSIGLVAVLVFNATWATIQLIDSLINGGPETSSASALLSAGSVVWVSNNLAFTLLYWEVDGGGAAARAHHVPRPLDFAFPQQMNPRIAPPGWTPRFIDYLYLGFTNATAFSPTDVMPLRSGVKIAMGAQSLVSLVLLALVVARAVNVLT